MSELHWTPRVVARRDMAEEMAEEISLQVPPQLGTVGPARMGLLRALSLSAWRELSTRWTLFVMLPAMLLLRAFLPEAQALAWSMFLGVLVVPIVVGLAAASGSGASDAFWRGLGGPAWARLLGRHLTHLLLIGPPVALTLAGLLDDVTVRDVFLWPLVSLYAGLYASVSAARTRGSGIALLGGPLVVLVLLAASSGFSAVFLRDWPEPLGAGVRLGLLALGAMLATYRWERRAGVWGAAVQRRSWLPPLGWAAAGLVALVGLESWGLGVMPPGYTMHSMADDGSLALFRNYERLDLKDPSWRTWAWTPERGYHRLPMGPVDEIVAGPEQALLYLQGDQITLQQGDETLSCSGEPEWLSPSWRQDGRAAFFGTGTGTVVADLDTGRCEPAEAIGWFDGALVHTADGQVHWRDQSVPIQPAASGTTPAPRAPNMHAFAGPGGAYRATFVDGALLVTGPHSLFSDPAQPRPDRWLGTDLLLQQDEALLVDMVTGTRWDVSGLSSLTPYTVGAADDGTLRILGMREVIERAPLD